MLPTNSISFSLPSSFPLLFILALFYDISSFYFRIYYYITSLSSCIYIILIVIVYNNVLLDFYNSISIY